MEILYILVPISVVVVFLIAVAFWWSLRNGQFDDLEGPGYRILMDDDKAHIQGHTQALQMLQSQEGGGKIGLTCD